MDEFLKLEYERCLDLLKHYDERQVALARFATGLSAAVAGLIFGVHDLREDVAASFWGFASLFAGTASLGLAVIFLSMIQNRLYFVFPARQANSIRAFMLKELEGRHFENQMYLSTTFSAFNFRSVHSMINLFVCLQVGAALSLFVYAAGRQGGAPCWWFWTTTVLGVAASAVLFISSGIYLKAQSLKAADRAIH